MNTKRRMIGFVLGIAGPFLLNANANADDAIVAISPLEIRALGEKLPKPGTSDAISVAEQCARILNQVDKLHDPAYDPDVELNLRRMALQEFRKTKNPSSAYVSWKEVSTWKPTNDVQLAIASLSMRTAKAIRETANSNLDDECRIVDSMRVSSAMRRSLMADLCSLHLKASWPGNMGGLDQICSKYKKLLASTPDANEQLALSSRMIRRAVALKTDWRKYRDIPGMNPWIETSRRQIVHDCGVVSAETERCLVSWMRIAALVQNYGRLVDETKDVLIETNRVLDEQGKTVRAEKVPYYAVVFGTMRQLLALDFFNHGVLGMEGEPFEIIQPYAKESAQMLGIEAGKDFEMFLRSVDGMVSLVKDKPDAIVAYLEREDIRDGVVKKSSKVETPEPGRFEPYPVSDELRNQLGRYGFEAGSFVQAAFRQTGKTNRVSYVIYTPKNASGKVPVLLFLPGIGEIGNDLSKLFRQRTIFDKVTSAEFQKKHPCYLVAISPPDGTKTLSGYDGDGDPTPLQRTIHDALLGIARTRKHPAVDENRIYVTGLSFGGTGAYALPFVYPGFFAASVPVSAHIFPAERLGKVLPCDFFHLYNEGELRSRPDDVSRLEGFGVRVRELGGDFRIGTFPNEGHNAWDAAWRDEAVWDWMFSKRRGANGAATRATGRVPDPTRSIGGGEENHAENAGSVEVRPPAVTASKPGRDGRTGPERAADGLDGTAYVSASPVSAGDWLQVEWSAPVQGRIEVRTGLPDGTLRLSKGRVEVSVDGRVWSRTGTVSQRTGVCAFQQRTGIRFLRLLPEPRSPEPLAVREIAVKP